MNTPYPVMTTIIVYLVFVLKIGPRYMQNREPFELKSLMMLYNLFQVAYNLWMIHLVVRTLFTSYQGRDVFSIVLTTCTDTPCTNKLVVRPSLSTLCRTECPNLSFALTMHFLTVNFTITYFAPLLSLVFFLT